VRSYTVTFVHPIAGACPRDTVKCNTLPDSAFSDSRALGKALRERGILFSGQSVREMRVAGNRVVVFPSRGGWHSITLTCDEP
jgi:hypothetical protein